MLAKYLLLVVLASVCPASGAMCSGDQFEVEGECVTADKSRQPRTFTISVEDERVVTMYENHERKDAKATVTSGDTGLFSIMDNNKPKLPFFTLEGKAGRFECEIRGTMPDDGVKFVLGKGKLCHRGDTWLIFCTTDTDGRGVQYPCS